MIVACQSRSSLKSYFETLNGSAREEYKLFKAECKNLCYDEVRSFYGLYVSNEKVTAATDYASAERLLDKFPFVGAAMITKVMLLFESFSEFVHRYFKTLLLMDIPHSSGNCYIFFTRYRLWRSMAHGPHVAMC